MLKIGDKVRINPDWIATCHWTKDPSGEIFTITKVVVNSKDWPPIEIHKEKYPEYNWILIEVDRKMKDYYEGEEDFDDEALGWLITEKEMYCCLNPETKVPLFIIEEQVNNNYCSCSNPVKKRVIISASLQYDICSVCKKEAI